MASFHVMTYFPSKRGLLVLSALVVVGGAGCTAQVSAGIGQAGAGGLSTGGTGGGVQGGYGGAQGGYGGAQGGYGGAQGGYGGAQGGYGGAQGGYGGAQGGYGGAQDAGYDAQDAATDAEDASSPDAATDAQDASAQDAATDAEDAASDAACVPDGAAVGQTTTCGTGACVSIGTTACVGGQIVDTCTPGTPAATDDTCDGIDNNCNGQTDEGYVGVPTSCGVGACAATGTTYCVDGKVTDSCTAGTPAATDDNCNGIDDNCNGQTDEGYVSHATSCGVGACARTGTTSCVNGAEVDSCTAGTPAATDNNCDGIDNNCNGQTDEGYVGVPTSCGVGACAATGTTYCVDGKVTDSCTAGTPAATDDNCNGIDDNCNGQTDEGYVSHATSCGVGACARTGTTSCENGKVVDTCMPGSPTGNDTTCDGIDNNCNGQTDENYVGVPTSCGVGACAATGTTSCENGKVVDTCMPGSPTGNDTTCDGIDNNCNGQTDENYVSQQTSCGVGACAATGTTSCVGGQVVDSCTPGTPAPSDTTCNGIDDNCNGQTDEGYVPVITTCGVGKCFSTGSTECVNGQVVDTCVPLC